MKVAGNEGREGWHESPASTVLHYESANWYSSYLEKVNGATKSAVSIAAFDLDHTLIRCASGAKFPKNATDLALWKPCVADKLAEIVLEGKIVVIFSNQGGVSSGKTPVKMIHERIEAVSKLLKVPICFFASTHVDLYRKPCIGMWELFLERLGDNVTINMEESFYVGDAAGRKGDHADSDFKFAFNTGLNPLTPEKFFLQKKSTNSDGNATEKEEGTMEKGHFEPRKLITCDACFFNEPENAEKCVEMMREIITPRSVVDDIARGFSQGDGDREGAEKKQTMVFLMGGPATGKSTFAKRYLVSNGYVYVNKDTLGTDSKCLKLTREALAGGKSVVIDNTNGVKASRAKYLDCKGAAGAYKICVRMMVEKEQAMHMNVVREVMTRGEVKRIKAVAFHTFYKRQVEPTLGEGFDSIGEVRFRAHFKSDKDKDIFSRYTGS